MNSEMALRQQTMMAGWQRTEARPAREKRGLGYLSLLLFLLCMVSAIQKAIPPLEALRPTMIIAIIGLATGLLGKYMRGEPIVHCGPTYMLFIFMAYAAASVLGAVWPGWAFATYIDALKVVAMFLLISNVVTSTRKLNGVAWAMCLGGLAPALGTIKNYFTHNNLVDGFRSWWVGVYSNPNDLAYAMAMLVPLALALTLTTKRWTAKIFALGCMGLYTLAIFFTFSRMGFLCLVIIFVMTLLRSQQRVRNFALLSFFLLICLPLVPARYWERTETIASYKKDRSAMERVEAWNAGIAMVENHPLLGVGPGCYIFGWVEKDSHGQVRSAHNTFFEALGELGIPGLILFLIFMLMSWKLLWRVKRDLLAERRHLSAEEFQQRFGELLPLVIALDIGFWVFTVSSLTGGLLFTWYPYIFSAMGIAARDIYRRKMAVVPEARQVG